MRSWKLLAACVALLLLAASANAVVFPLWVQDDFTLTFGLPGQPGSANGTFTATGQVINAGNSIVSFFMLSGTNPIGAQLVGAEYVTTYNSVLDMWSGAGGTGTHLWTGSGIVTTRVKAGGGTNPTGAFTYPVSSYYWHPSNPGYTTPSSYQSIGNGAFTGVALDPLWAGAWRLYVPWFGTYNWQYDLGFTYQHGNMQGKLMDVPEPGSLLLLAGGLVAVAVVGRRRPKIWRGTKRESPVSGPPAVNRRPVLSPPAARLR